MSEERETDTTQAAKIKAAQDAEAIAETYAGWMRAARLWRLAGYPDREETCMLFAELAGKQ